MGLLQLFILYRSQTGTEIVDISETKLCSDFPDAQFQVDGYVYPPYRKDRTKHGGNYVFAKNDLITKSKQEFESDSVQIISLEMTISSKKWIIFSFYRPPKSNIANFFSELKGKSGQKINYAQMKEREKCKTTSHH